MLAGLAHRHARHMCKRSGYDERRTRRVRRGFCCGKAAGKSTIRRRGHSSLSTSKVAVLHHSLHRHISVIIDLSTYYHVGGL